MLDPMAFGYLLKIPLNMIHRVSIHVDDGRHLIVYIQRIAKETFQIRFSNRDGKKTCRFINLCQTVNAVINDEPIADDYNEITQLNSILTAPSKHCHTFKFYIN